MKNNFCHQCLCDGSIDEFVFVEKTNKCNLCILQDNLKNIIREIKDIIIKL